MKKQVNPTNTIHCALSKAEMVTVLYEDRNQHDWLFWHLNLAILSAHDDKEDGSEWAETLKRAEKALGMKDFGELDRIIDEMDAVYNEGRCKLKEEEQKKQMGRPPKTALY